MKWFWWKVLAVALPSYVLGAAGFGFGLLFQSPSIFSGFWPILVIGVVGVSSIYWAAECCGYRHLFFDSHADFRPATFYPTSPVVSSVNRGNSRTGPVALFATDGQVLRVAILPLHRVFIRAEEIVLVRPVTNSWSYGCEIVHRSPAMKSPISAHSRVLSVVSQLRHIQSS